MAVGMGKSEEEIGAALDTIQGAWIHSVYLKIMLNTK